MFEERRRKGLSRFINAVAWHPVLGKDDVVIAFLSHPSEINSWKRSNFPTLDEEFVRKSHNITYLERLIPMDLDDRISRMKKRLSASIQQYEHMCFIMNQMNRLKKALGADYIRFSATLKFVSFRNITVYVYKLIFFCFSVPNQINHVGCLVAKVVPK